MATYLLSSISTNMVDDTDYFAKHTDLTPDEFEELKVGAVAVIRNPAFARILKVPLCKRFITLKEDDVALVVGTSGGKLPYDAKSLPPELSLTFEKIEIKGATV